MEDVPDYAYHQVVVVVQDVLHRYSGATVNNERDTLAKEGLKMMSGSFSSRSTANKGRIPEASVVCIRDIIPKLCCMHLYFENHRPN